MTSSNLEQNADWCSWEMDDLAAVTAAEEARRKEALIQTISESDEEIREHAFEEFRQKGFDEGLESGHNKGRSDGYQAGYDEGLAAAQQESEQQLKELQSTITQLVKNMNDALIDFSDGEIFQSLSQLANTIGEKLARRALDASPEIIEDLIRDIINAEPVISNQPRLRLHPDDKALLSDDLLTELQSLGWSVVADHHITQGGCLVNSKSGDIDARWEKRCEMLINDDRDGGIREDA